MTRRCAFCGALNPKLDLSGSPICSPACSGKELLRRAHATYPRVIEVLEIDGARVVDQVAWAAEWRRPVAHYVDAALFCNVSMIDGAE